MRYTNALDASLNILIRGPFKIRGKALTLVELLLAIAIVAFKDGKICNHLSVVSDGVEALAFLRREGCYANAPWPDLILLDLNLPKKDGRDVLSGIKAEENLKRIPVVVLTTSNAEKDVLKTYDLHANCYIIKPVDFSQFTTVVKTIENFWFNVIKLSKGGDADV